MAQCGNIANGSADPSASPWPKVTYPLRCLETAIYWAGGISILTGQSFRWIDLRQAGPLAQPLLIVWLLSLIALGLSRCLDIPAAPVISPRLVCRRLWLNRLLLIPSWMVMLALLANTLYYYHLLAQRHGNLQIGPPMCLLVLLAFAVWLGASPGGIFSTSAGSLPPPEKTMRLLRYGWKDRIFSLLFAALMVWVFSCEFRADPPPSTGTIDLGVVLGHAVLPGDICDRAMRNRTLMGVQLFMQHRIRYLMLSGSAPDGALKSHRNQPDAMLKIALSHRVPRNRIILDFHGDNTRYTAFNVRRVMRQRGFKTVVAISSDYHLPRTQLAFRQIGIKTWTLAAKDHQWFQTDPFSVIRELVAYPVYFFDRQYHNPDDKK